MRNNLQLLVTLARRESSEPLGIDRVVVSADGFDENDGDGEAERTLRVFESSHGWICSFGAAEEARPILHNRWTEIRGWRLKLIDLDDPIEGSLIDKPDFMSPEIEVSDGSGAPARKISLSLQDGAEWMIGRNPQDSDIAVQDSRVSRTHLRLFVRGGRHWAESLGRYGTYLDDSPLEKPRPLKHGDTLVLGGTRIRYFNVLDALPRDRNGSPPRRELDDSASRPWTHINGELAASALLFLGVLALFFWLLSSVAGLELFGGR